MSATLRYDVGGHAALVLFPRVGPSPETPEHFFSDLKLINDPYRDPFDARWVQRAGSYSDNGISYTWATTFRIKLPDQLGLIIPFMGLVHRTRQLAGEGKIGSPNINGSMVSRSCRTLLEKLVLSTGVPSFPFLDGFDRSPVAGVVGMEADFLREIDILPGDVPTWMAYADWLSEQRPGRSRRRSEVIAAILGDKATPMRYGVPIVALLDDKPYLADKHKQRLESARFWRKYWKEQKSRLSAAQKEVGNG